MLGERKTLAPPEEPVKEEAAQVDEHILLLGFCLVFCTKLSLL